MEKKTNNLLEEKVVTLSDLGRAINGVVDKLGEVPGKVSYTICTSSDGSSTVKRLYSFLSYDIEESGGYDTRSQAERDAISDLIDNLSYAVRPNYVKIGEKEGNTQKIVVKKEKGLNQ